MLLYGKTATNGSILFFFLSLSSLSVASRGFISLSFLAQALLRKVICHVPLLIKMFNCTEQAHR